ncbi:SDR family oxidoreductase [Arthrobacter sp. NPDC089319]|uniref:SDR family NAD(P)-dependent oxidoreductase n=1 Tax=Arthrobacter sp. NPDC089319 TaxID=3155915 RepID=UPI0034368BCD
MSLSPAAGSHLPQRIVVTGGSSGIGLAVARLFVREGSQVGIVGRNQDRLDAAIAELELVGRSRVVAARADVAEDSQLEDAVGRIAGKLGGIDALVCCAGIEGEMGAACEDVSAKSFREVLDVNVVGTFLAIKFALPFLRRAEGGSVTIVGSDSGFVAVPGMLAYNASKGALVQMTRALAVELFDEYGIRVNSVCPSIVDTPMARRGLGDALDNPGFPMQSADDIAWSVGYLASRRSRAVNGVNLLSDFGYTGRSSFPA